MDSKTTTARTRLIAADMPIRIDRYPVRELLGAFRELVQGGEDARLVLTGKRQADEIYSVWNDVDRFGIADRVTFLPYYERCERFPIKKQDADVWVSRHTPARTLTAAWLRDRLAQSARGELKSPKYALFFTSFQPEKHEGNSTLMRLWLDYLKDAGYHVHVAYYTYDLEHATPEQRRTALRKYELYKEIPVSSRLVGSNYDGLNLHVDDWCGIEALEGVSELVNRFEYDVALTNYSFMSAVLDRVAAYSRKVLITHDNFVDRNRTLLEQGYAESAWVSIDEAGERLACGRADDVVAMQDQEAEHFREMSEDASKVVIAGPLLDQNDRPTPATPETPIRIGYFGSSNWVNEQNVAEFMKLWAADPTLRAKSRLVIGGAICGSLDKFVPSSLMKDCDPEMVGRVPTPADFYDRCDVVINPERGGTGVKIKSLEAFANGVPYVSTAAGTIGFGSESPFHACPDFAGMIDRLRELAESPEKIPELAEYTVSMYAGYTARQKAAMESLLGPALAEEDRPTDDTALTSRPLPTAAAAPSAEAVEFPDRAGKVKMVVPEYVRENGADYHTEEFERFLKKTDVRGKRVLEIGSDFHLASARLFMANGAKSVLATNIGDWRSDEPMPEGVEFVVGDTSSLDVPDGSFDIIYGIAILEHIPNYEPLVREMKRLIAPGGVVYLQGCPLWAGTLGHHVYYSPRDPNFEQSFAAGGAKSKPKQLYSFAGNNPIPNWAHLALTPDELIANLIEDGVPEADATGMVRYVYNLDGVMEGSCSNFRSASEVLRHLGTAFNVHADRIWSNDEPNEYFERASEKYSEEDLRTLGLRVWARPKVETQGLPTGAELGSESPAVSVIIPFYNVQDYFAACLDSVITQDHEKLEIILVDDQSPDGSRAIAEKYAARDPRITIITHDENKGLGPARNTGAAAATGAYIIFLDSDDLFASQSAVSSLVARAESTGCPVVIGSADRLEPDGRLTDYDRAFDASHNGRPGSIIEGDPAFKGASFLPGGEYVPMRAWGTLIDRIFYQELNLDYPAGRHEDLPHTPFLYYAAGRVLYAPEIAVHYRNRGESLSTRAWGTGDMTAYADIWRHTRDNIARFGLEHYLGNSALQKAEHFVMKLRDNSIVEGTEETAVGTLELILADATGPLDGWLFPYTMDSLRSILDFKKYDYNLFKRLTKSIDPGNMVEYYRKRLSEPVAHQGPIPVVAAEQNGVATAQTAETKPIVISASLPDRFERNHARVGEMIDAYRKHAPASVKNFPSMLTEGDKAAYFQAGREYKFQGTIIDSGCFVGGTTISLIEGLRANPLTAANADKLQGLIRVYDLFSIDDDYILRHLQENYPNRTFETGGSFQSTFEDNLAEHAAWIDLRAGDVIERGYPEGKPIEIFGVDLCKALPVTDAVIRHFFPHLMPGALVMQQDYIHAHHPHIHLSMLLLSDCLEMDLEICWGGTVNYRCVKPITTALIEKRFGTDSSWYDNADRNAPLLRELAENSFYDENRWILLQVLAVYHNSIGDRQRGAEIYNEAISRYPQFEPEGIMKNLFAGVTA